MRTGQTHVHRYMRPLLERIERGEIDPASIITHRLSLDDAPRAYDPWHAAQRGQHTRDQRTVAVCVVA